MTGGFGWVRRNYADQKDSEKKRQRALSFWNGHCRENIGVRGRSQHGGDDNIFGIP
jgi:hypothetical protein